MIADINDGNTQDVRYIHWYSTSQFKVSTVLCYEKKRLYLSDMASSYWYILPKNGPIPYPSSCNELSTGWNNAYYGSDKTIWRVVIIALKQT